jgi:hypothetical protein
MAEAKTAIKGRKIQPGNDILPRYLQGSMYTTRAMRRANKGAGKTSKRGKKKLSQMTSSVPIDKHGFTVGGWSS